MVSKNCQNRPIRSRNTMVEFDIEPPKKIIGMLKSAVAGVHWSPSREKWCACISIKGKAVGLGRYIDKAVAEAAAIRARLDNPKAYSGK